MNTRRIKVSSFETKIYEEVFYIVNRINTKTNEEGEVWDDDITEGIFQYSDILKDHIESLYTRGTPTSNLLTEMFLPVDFKIVYGKFFKGRKNPLEAVRYISKEIGKADRAEEWSNMFFELYLNPDTTDSSTDTSNKELLEYVKKLEKHILSLEDKIDTLLNLNTKKILVDTITPNLKREVVGVRVAGKEYTTLQEYFNTNGITELQKESKDIVNILNSYIDSKPEDNEVYFINNKRNIYLKLK